MKSSRHEHEIDDNNQEFNEITREDFVVLCTKALEKSYLAVAPRNQKRGYLKYRKSIKKNYLGKLRNIHKAFKKKHGFSLFFQHKTIEYAGLGNCSECTDYFIYELLVALKNLNIKANVIKVASKTQNHGYVHIRIHLKGEKNPSSWELDSWRPRIIDITRIDQPNSKDNGKRKNSEFLFYGDTVIYIYNFSTQDFTIPEDKEFIIDLAKPEEDNPSCEATNSENVFQKHPDVYPDYTLEEAYNAKLLNQDGKICGPQIRSSWQ